MTRSNGAEVAERRAGLESDGSEHDITLIQRSWALARQMGILGPFVVLFVGENGSGKTTTLGKIASDLTGRGANVLIVAGDTFRAAAV